MLEILIVSIIAAVILSAAYVSSCRKKFSDINKQIEQILRADDIVTALNESNSLKPCWSAFEKTLTSVGGKIYSTIDASEIFNQQNLTRGMNMTFWQNYGGIFTGLGILGTFASLTLGLSDLDMSSDNIEVLQDGIKNLLSGVKSAFVTSLVGIGCALVYSVAHHHLMKNFQGNVQRLADKLDEKFPRRSVEDWLKEINVTAANHFNAAKRQTELFKNIDAMTAGNYTESQEQTTVLKNIGEQVSQAIHDALDEKLAEYADNICKAIDTLGEGAAQGLNNTISKVAGAQMDRFSAALDKFSDKAETIMANAQKVSQIMNEQLLNTLKELDESLKRQAEASAAERAAASAEFLSTLKNLTNTLNEVAEKIKTNGELANRQANEERENYKKQTQAANEEFLSMLSGLSKTLQEIVDKFNDIVNRHNSTTKETFDNVQKLLGETEKFLSRMDEASTALRQAAAPVYQSTVQLSKNLAETSTQMNNLANANRITRENIFYFTEKLRTFVENFDGIASELERSTKIINESLGNYNYRMREGLSDALTKFDDHMGKAVVMLHELLEELNDTLNEIRR